MRKDIKTQEEFNIFKKIAEFTSITRENRHEIANFYSEYIVAGPLCWDCNEAMWSALQQIKVLYNDRKEALEAHFAAPEAPKTKKEKKAKVEEPKVEEAPVATEPTPEENGQEGQAS